MSGYPSPGQYSNMRPAMNGGPNPYHQHHHQGHKNVRNNNHPVSSDMDSHYSNPYSDQQLGSNGSNNHNSNNNNKVAVHRPRINRKNASEEKTKSRLTTNFDPMKDRHMWAMWRTAVNGRIVDQVRKNEQHKHDAMLSPDEFSSAAGESDARTASTYGKDLASAPPLSRFIRLNQKSKNIAQGLMDEGQGKLETTQFIYYGLPRVTVNTNHNNRYINNNDRNNNYNNINGVQNGHNGTGNGLDKMRFYDGEFGGSQAHPLRDY